MIFKDSSHSCHEIGASANDQKASLIPALQAILWIWRLVPGRSAGNIFQRNPTWTIQNPRPWDFASQTPAAWWTLPACICASVHCLRSHFQESSQNRSPIYFCGKEGERPPGAWKDKVAHRSVWEIRVDIKKARQLLQETKAILENHWLHSQKDSKHTTSVQLWRGNNLKSKGKEWKKGSNW